MRLNYKVTSDDSVRTQMHFTQNEILLMMQIVKLAKPNTIRTTPLLIQRICQTLLHQRTDCWHRHDQSLIAPNERKLYFLLGFARSLKNHAVDEVIQAYIREFTHAEEQ